MTAPTQILGGKNRGTYSASRHFLNAHPTNIHFLSPGSTFSSPVIRDWISGEFPERVQIGHNHASQTVRVHLERSIITSAMENEGKKRENRLLVIGGAVCHLSVMRLYMYFIASGLEDHWNLGIPTHVATSHWKVPGFVERNIRLGRSTPSCAVILSLLTANDGSSQATGRSDKPSFRSPPR